MRTVDFFVTATCLLSTFIHAPAQTHPRVFCAGFPLPEDSIRVAAKSLDISLLQNLPAHGRMRTLVIFAQFSNEPETAIPGFASRLFDPDLPGSFSHFYRTMSFGQLQVQGQVLPKRYVSDQPAAAYLAETSEKRGKHKQFVREILQKADADVDWAQFDDDGPDGVPGSQDDDRIVDCYVFIILRSVPPRFLVGKATGIAGLGAASYRTTDQSADGQPIVIFGLRSYGTILEGGTFAQTAGTMAHEFGHALGLVDLYDLEYDDPEEDSAGIGRWGLMGWGARGWQGNDGPNPLCAWSREQLGWIGPDNSRLMEVTHDTMNVGIQALDQDGWVIKISLKGEGSSEEGYDPAYLLLERRVRTAHYYDRHLPGEGLLVWHVQMREGNNYQEDRKRVDLVCADGLYHDAGYPQGRLPDPFHGGDNLDFWAHDPVYTAAHGGNMGDATDPFDGIHFTHFHRGTNPSTGVDGEGSEGHTDLTMGITRQGDAMRVDIRLLRWTDHVQIPDGRSEMQGLFISAAE